MGGELPGGEESLSSRTIVDDGDSGDESSRVGSNAWNGMGDFVEGRDLGVHGGPGNGDGNASWVDSMRAQQGVRQRTVSSRNAGSGSPRKDRRAVEMVEQGNKGKRLNGDVVLPVSEEGKHEDSLSGSTGTLTDPSSVPCGGHVEKSGAQQNIGSPSPDDLEVIEDMDNFVLDMEKLSSDNSIRSTESIMAQVRSRLHQKNNDDLGHLTPVAVDGNEQSGSKDVPEVSPMAVAKARDKELAQGYGMCCCLCCSGKPVEGQPESSGFRLGLRTSILGPFAILMCVCSIIIIATQYFFMNRIADSSTESCNESVNYVGFSSLQYQIAQANNTAENVLNAFVITVLNTYFQDAREVVGGTYNLLLALYSANANHSVTVSSSKSFEFLQLNSSFLNLAAGSSMFGTLVSEVQSEDPPVHQLLFNKSVKFNEFMAWQIEASAKSQPKEMCELQPSGEKGSPCYEMSNSDLSYEGYNLQRSLQGQDVGSVSIYTDLIYLYTNSTTGGVPPFLDTQLSWGFAFAWPINYCGNYTCFAGSVEARMLTYQLSEISAEYLATVIKTYNGVTMDCQECSLYFVVRNNLRTAMVDYVDQVGLLVAGADVKAKFVTNGSTYATNYTESPTVEKVSMGLMESYGNWNSSELDTANVLFIKSISEFNVSCPIQTRANYSLYDEGSSSDLLKCVVVVTVPLYSSNLSNMFPVEDQIKWLAVLSLPLKAFLLNYTEQATQAQETLSEMQEETDKQIHTVLAVSVVVAVVCLILTLTASWFISGALALPIKRLEDNIKRLSALDFSHSFAFYPSRINEVNSVQVAFAAMYGALQTFAKFIPATVVRNIVRSEKGRQVNVKERVVTIMFSDIQGFTTIAEQLTVEDLLYLITRYLKQMTTIVEKYEGVVAEIQGDGLLAFWNTPDDCEDHATKALSAAIAQQQYLTILSKQFVAELGHKYDTLGEFKVRIGIHTGKVLTGTIGSDLKMKFGCMGDPVNLAARLEGLCKLYGIQIMCSEATLRLSRHQAAFNLRELDLVQVKGKSIPTRIYEVLGQNCPVESTFVSGVGEAEPIELTDGRGPKLAGSSWLESFQRVLSSPSEQAFRQTPSSRTRSGSGSSSTDADTPIDKSEQQSVTTKKSSTSTKKSGVIGSQTTLKKTTKSFHPKIDRHSKTFSLRLKSRVESYTLALHAYQAGDFLAAKVLLQDIPSEKDKVEALLLERINAELERTNGKSLSPKEAEGWTGVLKLDEKSF